MNAHRITCLFVVEGAEGATSRDASTGTPPDTPSGPLLGTPLGLIHIHDCLRAGLG